jgi:hypothetical protein
MVLTYARLTHPFARRGSLASTTTHRQPLSLLLQTGHVYLEIYRYYLFLHQKPKESSQRFLTCGRTGLGEPHLWITARPNSFPYEKVLLLPAEPLAAIKTLNTNNGILIDSYLPFACPR